VKILFVAAQIYLPQLYGGVQTSTDQLCQALIARGHQVSVLSELMPKGRFALRCRLKMAFSKVLRGCKVSRDMTLGYPVWRTWFAEDAVEYVAKQEKPDLIVLMTGRVVPIGLAAKRTGIPLQVQLHDVAFHAQGGDFALLGNVPCVANSKFTADRYHEAFGVDPIVIYPFIAPEKYRTETTRKYVTFVNPHPRKGLEIALQIARACDKIPFLFVEGWTLSAEQHQELMTSLSTLPNVTFLTSQKDMRKIYGVSKILLAPSIRPEEFGRVAAEAQISGIPVVASARGGLPEAVGPGGVLLPHDGPIDDWVAAIRHLWEDDAYYAEISARAVAHAERLEMTFAYQVESHEKALIAAAGGGAK
jgi:glycosyltransferase involved in cell wall biosynthesis